jgi:hypothetical protein
LEADIVAEESLVETAQVVWIVGLEKRHFSPKVLVNMLIL